MNTFTLNNTEYKIDEVSDRAKALVSLVTRAQEQLDLYNITYASLVHELTAELAEPVEEKEVEVVE